MNLQIRTTEHLDQSQGGPGNGKRISLKEEDLMRLLDRRATQASKTTAKKKDAEIAVLKNQLAQALHTIRQKELESNEREIELKRYYVEALEKVNEALSERTTEYEEAKLKLDVIRVINHREFPLEVLNHLMMEGYEKMMKKHVR